MGVILSDTFVGRTIGAIPVTTDGGWGTASDGHVWTEQVAGASTGVGSGEGRFRAQAATDIFTLDTSTRADSEILARFQVVDNTNDSFAGIFRYADASNYWMIGCGTPAASMLARIRRRSAAVNTDYTTAITITNNTKYWLRARLQGSLASVKIWQDGTNEPGAWTLTQVDAGTPTAAGLSGLAPFSASGDATDCLVDSLTVDDLQGGAFSPPLVFVPRVNLPRYRMQMRYMSGQRKAYPVSGAVQNVANLVAAALSFTGPVNLQNNITKKMTGILSFTGITNLGKTVTKSLVAAVLSFTGKLNNTITKALAAATLTFTGPVNLVKLTTKKMTGILSFTGAVLGPNSIQKKMAGVLSFTGAQSRAMTKGLVAAVLSFTGVLVKLTKTGLIGATLSFTGALAAGKQFARALVATLSFTGAALVNRTNKSMAAALSFTGTSSRAIQKLISGVLSFTGVQTRTIHVSLALAGALSFVGSISKAIKSSLVGATLSFVGALISGKSLHQALTATLNFTGVIVKQTSKSMTAVLSFTGVTNLGKALTKGMAATLSFVGSLPRFASKGFTASLSFVGAITRLTKKGLSAVLSFVGVLTSGSGAQQFTKALTATLSFVGSTNLGKNVKTGLQAVLSFVGFLPTPSTPQPVGAFPGSLITTIPSSQDIAIGETIPYIVDLSNYLSGTDTIGAYFMSLIILPGGQTVPWPWRLATTVVGNIMTITLLGSALQIGQQYQLRVTFVANVNKTLTFLTYINVVGAQ